MAKEQEITIPPLGGVDKVQVVEILVNPGDVISQEDPVISVESDKATMEIPAPMGGTVKKLLVSDGDEVGEGSTIAVIEVSEEGSEGSSDQTPPSAASNVDTPEKKVEQVKPEPVAAAPERKATEAPPVNNTQFVAQTISGDVKKAHASPSVRRFARELGADLATISGSGMKGRILKEDVQQFVKTTLQNRNQATIPGAGFSTMPAIDFSQFGEIETSALSKIKKISGAHLHRCWVSVPHVTQHDDADITELESFRQQLKKDAEKRQIRVTLLPFLIKAVVSSLQTFPEFNASLSPDGASLILKKYFHIGVAVDTPDGLMVPVLRDCDKKGVFELSSELMDISERARNKRLKPAELKGGCFSISSLGGIGGTAFTPIVNAPEVAILGVSRSSYRPVYQEQAFVPRLMLPLSLSYDHRVIDGAAAAKFIVYLGQALTDLRRTLL
ncbi:MAG: dihydrolipoyllysine-residue acetyltransferase [Methylococcaceae bacterium]